MEIRKKEQKNFTYQRIQPLKTRLFINQWAALRRKFVIKNMWKRNHMIVNWSAAFSPEKRLEA